MIGIAGLAYFPAFNSETDLMLGLMYWLLAAISIVV
jgi:hypothetical protein